jgi:hypothetical protein
MRYRFNYFRIAIIAQRIPPRMNAETGGSNPVLTL